MIYALILSLLGILVGAAFRSDRGAMAALVLGLVLPLMLILSAMAIPDLARQKRTNTYRRATGHTPVAWVTSSPYRQAFRLCETVEQLISTDAWSQRIVDRDRRVPSILWGAVVRSIELHDLKQLLLDARRHDSLRHDADLKQQYVDQLEDDVSSLEVNLGGILRVARDIDQRARDAAHARALEIKRRQEEEQLRTQLLGVSSVTVDTSKFESDHAAGLVAETEAVNQFLKGSDDLLRRMS